MKNLEIVDLLPLHRQMTLVIFRDPDTRKCEVQILPVSLETTELKALQEMLKIPTEPEADAATVSFEVEEALSREVLDWCEARDITSEQLVRAFICFCGEMKNVDVLRAWIRQEIAQEKIDIDSLTHDYKPTGRERTTWSEFTLSFKESNGAINCLLEPRNQEGFSFYCVIEAEDSSQKIGYIAVRIHPRNYGKLLSSWTRPIAAKAAARRQSRCF